MIYRRISFLKEMPQSCKVCSFFPMNCDYPIDQQGKLKQDLDKNRDKLCPLIELKESDIDYFYRDAKNNHKSSTALSEITSQKYKESHKRETIKMNSMLKRLDVIRKTMSLIFCNSDNISIKGHSGKWYVVDYTDRKGKSLFLLEHEDYGDEVACLIVDEAGSIILENVWNGFDDLDDFTD